MDGRFRQVGRGANEHINEFHSYTAYYQNRTINMAQDTVKIIERCQVAPPPSSLPSTTLPLTFFDIPWFLCSHIKRIFFYDFPYPTHHFLQTTLPILKHSLSLTLQHFFPFASNLVVPSQREHPFIRYLDGDSVSFTVAESKADNFTTLTSDSPQDLRNLHPLAPTLSPPRLEEDGTRVFPIMAIQVTILPNSGFSLCLTFNHLAADGKSLHHFIKHWACVCKARGDLASIEGSLPLPSHERDRVKDPHGLKLLYLQELENIEHNSTESTLLREDVFIKKVRSTIVLTREQVEKIKKYANNYNTGSGALHISTFVVTCSLIWVCLLKSEEGKEKCDEELCHLVILADCRDRPEFSLSSTYFGNCILFGLAKVKRSEVMGENAMVVAASAIERRIRELKSDAWTKAKALMSECREWWGKPSSVAVAGSPKLAVYGTDFGWGKPKKSEAAHIESSASFSLSDCRDPNGAIEVGLALENIRMNNFINILEHQLNNVMLSN
ncbi:hypothetical protein RJT34_28867 [Clitoria ternatea]|uniref:Anthocyanin acyltransferase n=1 Tax=Clitoria ternatea TaxID=43366 RepID=A0AAN9F9F3_CLITE